MKTNTTVFECTNSDGTTALTARFNIKQDYSQMSVCITDNKTCESASELFKNDIRNDASLNTFNTIQDAAEELDLVGSPNFIVHKANKIVHRV